MKNLMKDLIERKMEDLELEYGRNNDIDTNIYIGILTEYGTGCLEDIIDEISDSNVEVYTHELFKKSWDLYQSGFVDEAIGEFNITDLPQILMTADYLRNKSIMYENAPLMLKYLALEKLQDINTDTVPDEDIEDLISDIYKEVCELERLEDVEDILIDVIEGYRVD